MNGGGGGESSRFHPIFHPIRLTTSAVHRIPMIGIKTGANSVKKFPRILKQLLPPTPRVPQIATNRSVVYSKIHPHPRQDRNYPEKRERGGEGKPVKRVTCFDFHLPRSDPPFRAHPISAPGMDIEAHSIATLALPFSPCGGIWVRVHAYSYAHTWRGRRLRHRARAGV